MVRKRCGNELHPVYTRYRAILNRCNDPNHTGYKHYGAKGIRLSSDLMPFVNFRDYVISLPNYDPINLTIDRIESTKGYEKGNLQWADMSTQVAKQIASGKGNNSYTGVNWSKTHNRWIARVYFKGKCLFSRSYLTELEALDARNDFLLNNNLPHLVQPI